jgi:hypothetical protein
MVGDSKVKNIAGVGTILLPLSCGHGMLLIQTGL